MPPSGRMCTMTMACSVNHKRVAGAILAAVATMAGGNVRAQVISNTATVEWRVGSATVVRPSNRLDIVVVRAPSPPDTGLTLWHLSNAPGATPLPVPTTMCHGTGTATPIVLDGVFAGVSTAPASVTSASQLRAGEPIIFSFGSRPNNRDPLVVDTMTITLRTSTGDSEQLTVRESGNDTGVFMGVIATDPAPPAAIRNNCRLSVAPGEKLMINVIDAGGAALAQASAEILIDPYGAVFDSGDGDLVMGTRVTIVEADTNQPAVVFGEDGRSRYPATVTTGSIVTDAGGMTYRLPSGAYRFPYLKPGRYKILAEPPAPYLAPSKAKPTDLTGFRRPDGAAFVVDASASYSGPFTLLDPAPVQIDIPVDRPGTPLSISKTASQAVAVPGDAVRYTVTVRNADATRTTGLVTVTDVLPDAMRLKPNTVHYNASITAYQVSSDGQKLTVTLPSLAGGATGILSYLLEVRPGARAGQSVNRAQATDDRGTTSPVADAVVRIARDDIGDRLTIIGRVTDGGCVVDPTKAAGVFGVRVMLEDGSYAVTDADGRYHFEGVLPGAHVVQIDPSTLGAKRVPVACMANARSAGSAISRFVSGQGGVLVRADFHATAGDNASRQATSLATRAKPASDGVAAGAERDWVTGQTPGIAWLFPEPEHNPRTKAVRVAIKHLPGQTVVLSVGGKPVNPLAFDGAKKSGDGQVVVSLWRAIDIGDRATVMTAEVRNADGSVAERLSRPVHYAPAALHAELLRDRSVLVADGVTRPVIALRLTDRDGRPVHHGLVGDFDVPDPYAPAVEVDAQSARQLAGLERARPVWRVEGEEGIAYLELEPTTASGAIAVTLPFRDGEVTRTQRIDLWLDPGNRPWTIVGLAEGSVGFNSVERNLQDLDRASSSWLTSGRLALYAKGRVKGRWLMTLAYDSAKTEDETRFAGVIDPSAYYTIYADRSERRYDAASVRKLYLKLERPQFYALFGDYQTDLSDAQLTRYNRALNGLKAQFRSAQVGATAFVADTPYRHRREELQGNGLSGPYGLAARDILPNSEVVVIETRDRFRSDRIVERRTLSRHIDYDIDYIRGTLRFRAPLLSRSSGLDPQFIVIDYEVDGIGQRVVNAGGRATWNNAGRTLTVGASAIRDEDDRGATNVGGLDLRYTPNAATEVRAEIAASRATAKGGAPAAPGGTALAWLVEAEHHGPKYDVLAYAREQQSGFGVGQLNFGEQGTRKFGFDGRLRILPDLSVIASAWHEDYLRSNAQRRAGRVTVEYRGKSLDLRAGLQFAQDRLIDGREASSTIGQLGATKRLFDNRLELDALAEFAVDGDASIDFPARQRLGARFAITPDVTLVGSYERARGDTVRADTARLGFDLKPWTGARLLLTANRQDIDEYGPRSFASYGLAQSLPLGKRWTVDATIDGSRTLGGIDPTRVLNEFQPVASGGVIGSDGTITEDFIAVTGGATYRGDRWSANARAEYRNGDRTTRYGLIGSALRQLGEGRALGGTASWFRAEDIGGTRTEVAQVAVSWAHRPETSRVAWLEKLELRSDAVRGGTIGGRRPIGGATLLAGDAISRRIINSFSLNWSPTSRVGERYLGRSELALFWGSRYIFDRVGGDEVKGWSNLIGADARWDLSDTFDLGLSGTVRQNAGGRALSYSGGPSLGVSPAKGSYVQVGYNVLGFHDADYAGARYTRAGPFVTLKLKFDQTTFDSLGLGRR